MKCSITKHFDLNFTDGVCNVQSLSGQIVVSCLLIGIGYGCECYISNLSPVTTTIKTNSAVNGTKQCYLTYRKVYN